MYVCVYHTYTYIHIYTHTHIYIYIYIYKIVCTIIETFPKVTFQGEHSFGRNLLHMVINNTDLVKYLKFFCIYFLMYFQSADTNYLLK